MIHNLSNNITTFFVNNFLIKKDEADICCYGMEIIISTLVGFGSILVTSVLFGNILFGMLYLFFIVPIRMCVGGYHAKSYLKCNIVFVLFFVLAFWFYSTLDERGYIILGLINLLSVILILCIAPLENKNKKLTERMKKRYKRIDAFIYILGGACGIYFDNLNWINIMTIVLNIIMLLLMVGKGVEVYEKRKMV